ncbi:MAG: precorrin-6A reductase [Actinobacteria bacterium]|nr:precorrin-6A reductase [Actinomycetota bacterium]
MILILGGTIEARLLLEKLVDEQRSIIISTAHEFAGKFIGKHPSVQHIAGKLNVEGLQALIREKGVNAVVDATHPYALEISRNAIQACSRMGVRYIRLERATLDVDFYEKARYVDSFEEAAVLAGNMGKVIFIATGSNSANVFLQGINRRDRKLYIRVLPDENSIDKCLKAGFARDEIITDIGPFSYKDNYHLWQDLCIDVVVTKDSGLAGGFTEKLHAARDLGIGLVVVKRPAPGTKALKNIDEVIQVLRIPYNSPI